MSDIEPTEKASRRRRIYHGGLFLPVVLITVGILFLLKNFNLISGDVGSTLLKLWPLLLILIGLDNFILGRGLAGPVFITGLGVVFLLNNFGNLPWNAWELILRLWPVLIIAIGLDIVVGRRSAWGSLLALFLMLAVLAGALLLIGVGSPATDTNISWNPTQNVTHIYATLNPAVGTLRVNNLQGKNSLAEGILHLHKSEKVNSQMLTDGTFTIKSEGNVFFAPIGRPERWIWDINFTSTLPIDLNVDMGVGEIDLNLSQLKLNQLNVNLGVGKVTLAVPATVFTGKVNSAIGETVLILPKGSEAQIKVKAGISAVDVPSGFTHSGDYYTSAGYNTTGATRINLEVDHAIGHLLIEYAK